MPIDKQFNVCFLIIYINIEFRFKYLIINSLKANSQQTADQQAAIQHLPSSQQLINTSKPAAITKPNNTYRPARYSRMI